MYHTAPAVICLFVALALAAPGSALHCNGNIITINAGGETLYVDDRSEQAGEIDHWVYLESNDVKGLQSGSDNPCLDLCFHDPCPHADPDTPIF